MGFQYPIAVSALTNSSQITTDIITTIVKIFKFIFCPQKIIIQRRVALILQDFYGSD